MGLRSTDSKLTFRDDDNLSRTIFLPAFNLAAGQRLDLWVAIDGSTYYGTAAQTEPDFSDLARSADLPFVALQPGFKIDVVATGLRLPVNIAFVPNPGPNPDDPLYYVTELYGSIQVVRRDGTRQTFATGLLGLQPAGTLRRDRRAGPDRHRRPTRLGRSGNLSPLRRHALGQRLTAGPRLSLPQGRANRQHRRRPEHGLTHGAC